MRSAKEIAWDVVGEAPGMLYLTSDERASIAVAIEKAIAADRAARAPLAGRVIEPVAGLSISDGCAFVERDK